MIHVGLAISVIALTTLLAPFARSATPKGGTVTNGLPDSLPMMGQGEMAIREWIVTNRTLMCSTTLIFTNKLGIKRQSEGVFPFWTNFVSYAHFQAYTVNRVMVNDLPDLKSKYSPTTEPIFLLWKAFYKDDGDMDSYTPLVFKVNLGTVDQVTSDVFINADPVIESVHIPIFNVQKLEIVVDSDPPFVYPNTPSPSPWPEQVSTKDGIVLCNWYCVGDYKARIKVTANGKTRIYTQFGTALEAPKLKVIAPPPVVQVETTFTPGSETLIESSVDLVHWEPEVSVPWYWNGSKTIIYAGTGSQSGDPHRIFRARSE